MRKNNFLLILILFFYFLFAFENNAFAFSTNIIMNNKDIYSNDIVKNKIKLEFSQDYLNNDFILFGGLIYYNTEQYNPFSNLMVKNNNFSYDLGFMIKIFSYYKNNFFVSTSYYKAQKFDKILYFSAINEIFDKVNFGFEYNYDDYFYFGGNYNKYTDFFKDSYSFFIKQYIIKNKYFDTAIGYEYYDEIKTSNNYKFEYSNFKVNLSDKIKNYINKKNIMYFDININFLKNFSALVNVNYVNDKLNKNYFSYGINFINKLY